MEDKYYIYKTTSQFNSKTNGNLQLIQRWLAITTAAAAATSTTGFIFVYLAYSTLPELFQVGPSSTMSHITKPPWHFHRLCKQCKNTELVYNKPKQHKIVNKNRKKLLKTWQLRMHCNLKPPDDMPVLFRFNYDAHAKFEVAQPIRCSL